MGTLIWNNYDDILNELYVGETPFITKLIDAVSTARAPYVGKMKKPIKGNKDFIKIGDMIAEEFGFHAVTFMVPFDTSMNAFTYPITMSIDETIVGKKPKFFKDQGLKYDNITARMCIIVAVTSGVWFNAEITDREVVAAILHEVGHSFVTQSEKMIDIIEANRLGLAYALFYKLIYDIISVVGLANVPNDIKNIMNASNKGREAQNKIAKELSKHPVFAGISSIPDWIGGIAMNVFKEIFTLFADAGKILALPLVALNRILAVFDRPNIAVSRSQEYLSDSFAAMYGLGPEISTFLTKIEFSASPSGAYTEKLLSSIPIIGALRESINIPILLMTNSINTHPSTPARMNKILEELNKELKESDLSPKTKAALKKNIAELEKVKNECATVPEKKNYNALMVKKMWMAFLTNKNEKADDLEDYYTDWKTRDKYVRETYNWIDGKDPIDKIELK